MNVEQCSDFREKFFRDDKELRCEYHFYSIPSLVTNSFVFRDHWSHLFQEDEINSITGFWREGLQCFPSKVMKILGESSMIFRRPSTSTFLMFCR